MKYQPVIGLEVHVELNTKSKMFCRCSADYFGKQPNSLTCPVCLGLPGALPYTNEEAIYKCIQIGLALNCQISKRSYFERKNYFYPDLPKGFQISQYVRPIAYGGWLIVEDKEGNISKIRINRTHQEEDTGKLSHIGGVTLIDFNRSGVPLVEIVTEPDFTDSSQIKDYAKKLQQIFRYLGVSNADMERGDMRLEANVSVRKIRNQKSEVRNENMELPPYRVELKNINSFRFMVAAVEHEIKRQVEALEKGEKLSQETRGWNEDKKETYLQRSKEEAHDYRYSPEPDLPELQRADSKWQIEKIKQTMPELPWDKVKRYQKDWDIKTADTKVLAEDKQLAEFFEQAVDYGKTKGVDAQAIANYLINQKIDLIDSSPAQVVDDIVAKKSGMLSDEEELEKICNEAISENPKVVEDFKKGKEAALQVLIGSVMKKTSGKADVSMVRRILEKLLE